MKTLVTVIRWFTGILFIFSGLVKANDPLGLSYKTQEFFEAWGWHGLNDYTLILSVLMIAFEIIAGVAVIVGWQMRLFSWLLLLLILFFLYLTGYAMFSGKIRTCGCFGDCLPIPAAGSFAKDVLLLFLVGVIFYYRKSIFPSLKSGLSLVILLITTLFSFGFQFYVLRYLPTKDCLPYKQGNDIVEMMKMPAGSIPDSTVISFVYNKEGKEIEFTSDGFPADFNDSTYQFVKRYDKLIRKGNAEPPIKDFSLKTRSGNDTTEAVLTASGKKVFFFIKEMKPGRPLWQKVFNEVVDSAQTKGVPLYIITSDPTAVQEWIGQGSTIPVLACDAVAVKTAARANPTIMVLEGSVVLDKRSHAQVEKIKW